MSQSGPMLLFPKYSIFAHHTLLATSGAAASSARKNVHSVTASMSRARAGAPGAARRRQPTAATDAEIADVASDTRTRAERCQVIRCQSSIIFPEFTSPSERSEANIVRHTTMTGEERSANALHRWRPTIALKHLVRRRTRCCPPSLEGTVGLPRSYGIRPLGIGPRGPARTIRTAGPETVAPSERSIRTD